MPSLLSLWTIRTLGVPCGHPSGLSRKLGSYDFRDSLVVIFLGERTGQNDAKCIFASRVDMPHITSLDAKLQIACLDS